MKLIAEAAQCGDLDEAMDIIVKATAPPVEPAPGPPAPVPPAPPAALATLERKISDSDDNTTEFLLYERSGSTPPPEEVHRTAGLEVDAATEEHLCDESSIVCAGVCQWPGAEAHNSDDKPVVLTTSDGWEIKCLVDSSRPCQSLRSLQDTSLAARRILREVGTDNTAAFASVCFEHMLMREQELEEHFCVFYHSYNGAALLYEVQAEIARFAFGLPDDFAPLPRVDSRPFKHASVEGLMASFSADGGSSAAAAVGNMQGQDHDPRFRALAISASPSLFASGSEAPPLHCFRRGYGCQDLSFRELLVKLLLDVFRMERSTTCQLVDELVVAALCYGLPCSGYGTGCQKGRNMGRLGGQMLQIFVARTEVDRIAYHSRPMGVPVRETRSVREWLASPWSQKRCKEGQLVDGQVRILFRPEVFIDPKRGRLFHYCSDWEFLGGDPDMEGSRAAFVVELRKLLAPVLRSQDASSVKERLCSPEGSTSSAVLVTTDAVAKGGGAEEPASGAVRGGSKSSRWGRKKGHR